MGRSFKICFSAILRSLSSLKYFFLILLRPHLRYERRLATMDLTADTQKLEQATRSALEKLTESGMVEAHGSGRGRTYTLLEESK